MPNPATTPRSRLTRRLRLALLTLAPVAFACGSGGLGGGRDGLEPSGDFPDKARVVSGVQARLSERGFQFLGDNLQPIIEGMLEDGLGVCLAGEETRGPFGGEYGYCTENPCDEGSMGCQLSMELQDAAFLAVPPSTIAVDLTIAEFEFVLDAKVKPLGFPLVDCDVTLSSPEFPVRVPLDLRIEEPDSRLGFSLGDPEFDLADLDLEMGGTLACDIVNVVFSVDFIEDLLFGAINGPVKAVVHGLAEAELCVPCDEQGECPATSTCGGGDLCRLPDEGNRCVGKGFGVEGEFDVASMLGDFVRGEPSPLEYLVQPGGFVHVESGGVTLGVIAGTAADPSDCVPRSNPPAATEAPVAEAIRGNTDPAGQEFHAAIGVHETLVDRALWTAYDGGMLCLAVDSSISEFLSTGTFGLLLPSLKELTEGDSRPMMLVLAPQSAPEIALGAGTVVEDPEDPGNFQMDEPLLTVGLKDMSIHFYTVVDERWVRVFTLDVDLSLPVGVAVVEDGGLLPVLGDLTAALERVEVKDAVLLAEDPSELESLLPNLLGLALPLLGDTLLSPIDLPTLMGFQLTVQSISGIEANSMIGVFTELALAAEEGGAQKASRAAKTHATLLEVRMPPSPRWGRRPKDAWPRVRLDVSQSAAGDRRGAELEYQVKVDGTGWSLFHRAPDGVLIAKHPLLMAPGDHRVQVRARVPGHPASLDRTPTTVMAPVEWPRPQGRLGTRGFHGRTATAVDAAPPAGCEGGCAVGRPGPARGRSGPAWRGAGLRHPALALLLALTGPGCEDERPPGPADAGGAEGGGEGADPVPCDAPAADCALHECDPGFVPELVEAGEVDEALCERVGVVCDCVEAPPSPLGAIGRYVDVARNARGGLVFAAYNSTYGDLMFAETSGPVLPEDAQWHFVDGVPEEGRVRGAPSGPRGGVEMPGPDVGRHAAVAALGGGRVLIAYRDRTSDGLKLARSVSTQGERTWALGVLDDAPGAGTLARMSLGEDGSIAVAYRIEPVVEGRRSAGLRVAWSADGESFDKWDVEVRSLGLPCGGMCAGADKCVLVEDACARPGGSCEDGCADGSSCFDGACKEIWLESPLRGLRSGTPVGLDVARDAQGRLVVVWHDRTAGVLRRALVGAQGVVEGPETVAGAMPEGMTPGEVGRHPALWIDEDGAVHVVYVDAGHDQLLHQRLGEGAATLVDRGYRTSTSGRVSENLVGANAVLARDRAGELVVVYQDQTFLDVLAATPSGEGWHFQTLVGHRAEDRGAYGFYNLALPGLSDEPGDLMVITYVYDHAVDPPAHGLAMLWR